MPKPISSASVSYTHLDVYKRQENGLRAIVRFTRGDHGSIINPTADVGTTAEMQGQLISFLKSAGTELEITYHPVVK